MVRKLSILLITTLFLSACASSGKVVPRGQTYSSFAYGAVVSSEDVTIGGSQSGIGAYAGSLAAVLDSTSDSFLSIFARSILGSVVGANAEEIATRKSGKQYRIEMNNGDIVQIASANKEIPNGSCVEIERVGGRSTNVRPALSSRCLSSSSA